MNDLTTSPAERIRAFAAAVRDELADLPEDDIDDLVGGLVGDLTDQAADSGGDIELGDPVEYARELRAAAGLPERADAPMSTLPWHARLSGWIGRLPARIRSSAFGAWLLDLLGALRPVWWVARGWILYAFVGLSLGWDIWPRNTVAWIGVIIAVLVSVQWGRGRWLPKNPLRHIATVASIAAVLLIPWTLGEISNRATSFNAYDDMEYLPPDGLLLDGAQVGNLFVYDRDGMLIDGAQIYTGKGTPLNLYGKQSRDVQNGWDDQGDGTFTVPERDLAGKPLWNIYPLQVAPLDEKTGEADSSQAQAPTPPFVRAPQRQESLEPTPTASPEPTLLPTAAPETPAS
ncbi:hypothetical protein [Microbacterium sp. NPDC057741]|uniref:hypothetical protein n=2 Tax=unclassified Microbacterium TaxID=2609290 RepID=UPI00366C47D5